jgi:PII-like signaling protein
VTASDSTASANLQRLTIIVDSDAVIGHRPVYTEIVRRAHAAGLAGASVFRGVEGFGASQRVHTSRILSLAEDLPAMIVIIDSADAISRFLPELASLGGGGVATVEDVRRVRLAGSAGGQP